MNEKYQLAIAYYKNNEDESIKSTAIKFGIDRLTLGQKLTELGINDSKDRQKKYSFNENFFEDIITPEQAYYLGWLHSDGNINDHQVRLRIAEKDNEVLYRFNEALNGDLPIKQEAYTVNRKTPVSNLTICSSKMVKDLLKYGIKENKTFDLKFYNFDKPELTKAYICGIFDGDGWCSFGENSREIGFCGTYDTCEGIKNFLEKECSAVNIRITPIKSIYRIRICNKASIVNIYEKIFLENKKLCLSRKFNQIEEFAVSERAHVNRKVALK